MHRISVIGVAGSGKSTVARRLAAVLDLRRLELDSVFHQPRWSQLPDQEFRRRVGDFVASDRWIVDGNYFSHGVADLVWLRADTIVWLDPSRSTVMRRVIARTLRRVVTREKLWNDNQEPWSNLLDPRPDKNVIVWAWTRHATVRERYVRMSADGTWAHAHVERLRSEAEVESFFARADRAPEPEAPRRRDAIGD